MIFTGDNGGAFRVETLEVMRALIADDISFRAWCDGFLRPYLIEGKSVAVRVITPDSAAATPPPPASPR